MRHRTHHFWDNAIEAVIDARNHTPLPQIQRDILCTLTRRLREEGLFGGEPGNQSKNHDRSAGGIRKTDSQPAH